MNLVATVKLPFQAIFADYRVLHLRDLNSWTMTADPAGDAERTPVNLAVEPCAGDAGTGRRVTSRVTDAAAAVVIGSAARPLEAIPSVKKSARKRFKGVFVSGGSVQKVPVKAEGCG